MTEGMRIERGGGRKGGERDASIIDAMIRGVAKASHEGHVRLRRPSASGRGKSLIACLNQVDAKAMRAALGCEPGLSSDC